MFKRILISVFVCLFTFTAPKLLANDDIIALVDSLLNETHHTMRSVDLERTIELSSKALALSSDAKYERGMVRSYYVIGQALFHNQNYNSALSYLSRAEKVKNNKKYPLYMAQIYKVKGQIYFYLDMTNKSLREFNRAEKTAQLVERDDYREYILSQIYESLITVYAFIEDKEKAFEYMQKGIAMLDKSDNEELTFPNKINLLSQIGEYYLQQRNYERATDYLNDAMLLIDKYEFRYNAFTKRVLGNLFFDLNDYELALKHYKEALANATDLGLKVEYPILNRKLSEVFEAIGMTDSATFYHNRQIFTENELLQEKVSSADKALQILMDEESGKTRKRIDKALRIAVFTTLLLSVLVFSYMWRWRHRVVNEEVEAETSQLKQQLNVAFDEVMELARNNDSAFMVRFQEVYPKFFNKLFSLHPDLTATDQKLCAMTYLNIPTADIAKYTYVENRTVQTRRSRLRKKINLPSDVDLYAYLKSL